jgi:hypothetical protein
MTRLMIALSGTAIAAGASVMLPASAEAQSASPSEIVVYGNDPCPRSTDDQVVICSRRPETERYRLPENYRPSGTRQEKQAWANKARSLQNVGATGANSCSAVGPGGFTGCLIQDIKQARRETRERADQSAVPEE